MSSEASLLETIASHRAVFWVATAAPALLFRHNRGVYHRSREVLQGRDGALATMRQLRSWLVYKVGRRMKDAVTELGGGSGTVLSPSGEPASIPIEEAVESILSDSEVVLADFVELRSLREQRRQATERVRGLSRILQWGVWAVPVIAVSSFAAIQLLSGESRDWLLVPPVAALVIWAITQLVLVVLEWTEDRIDDAFAKIQERHLDAE